MRVVKNANELFIRLQGIYNRYDTLFAPLLAKLRSRYSKTEWDTVQPELEAHRRCWAYPFWYPIRKLVIAGV